MQMIQVNTPSRGALGINAWRGCFGYLFRAVFIWISGYEGIS